MKSNWFKYVFIIFIIIIVIIAILKIRTDEEEKRLDSENSNSNQERISEIKLGIVELDNINPILSNNKNVQNISKLIYEPLIELSENYKAIPCLAKEWAKQSDNSYLIKLKENIKWSDGQKFTAQDVKFTIDKLKEISSIYSYNVQYVTGVEIVDDYTIKISLDREVPFFEYNLTFPILSKDFYNAEDFISSAKNESPIGTGKYKISKVEPSYITLTKNNSWWNKETEVSLEKITVNKYSSVGELYNSFKIGNIDLIATDNINLSDYIGSIGYSSKEIKGREHTFLALNTRKLFPF